MNGLYAIFNQYLNSQPGGAQSWQSWLQSQQANMKPRLYRKLEKRFGPFGSGTPGGPVTPPNYNPVIPSQALNALDTKIQANLLSLAAGGDPYGKSKKK
jgi:hypothetical protein